MKRHYEERRDKERHKANRVEDWARAALKAFDDGTRVPPTSTPVTGRRC